MGNICKWDEISTIAKKYGLKVIEDSADTLGAKLNGKGSGYYTDMSITSFYDLILLIVLEMRSSQLMMTQLWKSKIIRSGVEVLRYLMKRVRLLKIDLTLSYRALNMMQNLFLRPLDTI